VLYCFFESHLTLGCEKVDPVIASLVLGVFLTVLLTLGLLFGLISYLFMQLSGWSKLAARYGCNPPDGVWTIVGKSATVGIVRYRRIVKAGLRTEGLYLRIGFPGHKAICIPWSDFGEFQPGSIYRQPGMRMTAGKPPIAKLMLSMDLYRAMWPHLSGKTT
jgi:hypothetical protein